jgi:hypothetical protein
MPRMMFLLFCFSIYGTKLPNKTEAQKLTPTLPLASPTPKTGYDQNRFPWLKKIQVQKDQVVHLWLLSGGWADGPQRWVIESKDRIEGFLGSVPRVLTKVAWLEVVKSCPSPFQEPVPTDALIVTWGTGPLESWPKGWGVAPLNSKKLQDCHRAWEILLPLGTS